MHHTIGDEFTWAREGMAELLCEDGLEVREVTTDPDSSAGRAADSLYKDGQLYRYIINELRLIREGGGIYRLNILLNFHFGCVVLIQAAT